jgi:hypothetical protein
MPQDWHSAARWSFGVPQAQKLAHCWQRLIRRSERIVAKHFSQFFGILHMYHMQSARSNISGAAPPVESPQAMVLGEADATDDHPSPAGARVDERVDDTAPPGPVRPHLVADHDVSDRHVPTSRQDLGLRSKNTRSRPGTRGGRDALLRVGRIGCDDRTLGAVIDHLAQAPPDQLAWRSAERAGNLKRRARGLSVGGRAPTLRPPPGLRRHALGDVGREARGVGLLCGGLGLQHALRLAARSHAAVHLLHAGRERLLPAEIYRRVERLS